MSLHWCSKNILYLFIEVLSNQKHIKELRDLNEYTGTDLEIALLSPYASILSLEHTLCSFMKEV